MASISLSGLLPSVFTGENYDFSAAKMKAYLKAYDLWEITKSGIEPPPLSENPTIAQLKQHSEEVAKKIITYETAKEAWDRLQEEYRGNARTRQMQVLNLRREYETLKMKDSESVKEYSDRLMRVVNQIRLLGDDLPNKRVVEKVEGALFVKGKHKVQTSYGVKKHQQEKKRVEGSKAADKSDAYPPCPHCKKIGHSPKWCWYMPGVQCKGCKQFGHVQKVCKNIKEKQSKQLAQVAENQQQDQQEEHLFTATNHKMCSDVGTWLLDSGYIHHMTSDSSIFVKLESNYKSKVKVGNGEYVKVDGIGVIFV
ncbi:uncharacterized protein LOC111380868 [Olea europaea var. sylvestris]|uniref:uncharacterized protein LOC111380868 n=1 Tax=Olea europaea var. sylvestris TaxID=158386 RepID=UPI000C1CF559|nr:uncharacterized protein LOC111380868 [Olea europaea var. sylvestris]